MLPAPTDYPVSPMVIAGDLRAAVIAGDNARVAKLGQEFAATIALLLVQDLDAGRAALVFLCSKHHKAEVATMANDVLTLARVAAAEAGRSRSTSRAVLTVRGRSF